MRRPGQVAKGDVSRRRCYRDEGMRAVYATALSISAVCACAQLLGLDADLPRGANDGGDNAGADAGLPGPYCEGKHFDRCFDFGESDVTSGLLSYAPDGSNATTFDRAHFSSDRDNFRSGPASLRYQGSRGAYRDTLHFTTDKMRQKFVLAFELQAMKKNDVEEFLASIEFANGIVLYFKMDKGNVSVETSVLRDGGNVNGPRTPPLQVRPFADWHHYEILYDFSIASTKLTLVLDGQASGDAGSRESVTLPGEFREGAPLVTFGRMFCSFADAGEDILLFDNVTFKGQ
jgi:hypothetical protein